MNRVQTERAEWDALLDQVGPARMAEPGVAGEWSVKDIIAHITWFEREMVGMLRAHALVGSELWNLAPAERNAAIFEENRDRPLDDVLKEAPQVFQQLVELVQALDERDLIDPSRFPGMPAEWQPWKIMADNTFDHYRAHAPDIRAWLNTPSPIPKD
jgi:uncharacterized protein (TIGR03083 family)